MTSEGHTSEGRTRAGVTGAAPSALVQEKSGARCPHPNGPRPLLFLLQMESPRNLRPRTPPVNDKKVAAAQWTSGESPAAGPAVFNHQYRG